MAGGAPATTLDIQVGGDAAYQISPTGTDNGNGSYNYQGAEFGAGWSINYNYNAWGNPADFARVNSGYDITNSSDAALEFHILVTLPLDAIAGAPSNYAGSAGLTLTGEDGMVQAPDVTQAIWEAQINGVGSPALSLWPFPDSLSFAGQGSDDVSGNLSPGVAGAVSSIGIQMNFILSPGETLTVTGIFGVAPTPGALALFGLAAIGGRRRRRD
jgi:MYXO-CTERM domain-containing protein